MSDPGTATKCGRLKRSRGTASPQSTDPPRRCARGGEEYFAKSPCRAPEASGPWGQFSLELGSRVLLGSRRKTEGRHITNDFCKKRTKTAKKEAEGNKAGEKAKVNKVEGKDDSPAGGGKGDETHNSVLKSNRKQN